MATFGQPGYTSVGSLPINVVGDAAHAGFGGFPPPYIRDPNFQRTGLQNAPSSYPGNPWIANPIYTGGGNLGNLIGGGGGGGGFSGSSGGSFSGNTFADVFSNIFGGGNINFGNGTPEGFNPYQFTPTVQNLQRPNRAFLPLSDEEEAMRQYLMGTLLGERPGEQAGYEELLNTVQGDYLHPESNPYLTEQINALSAESTDRLNESINQLLARAGVGGALGGSRAALMQGQAAGETGRAFDQMVADLLSGNYQRERGLQLSAIPGLVDIENMLSGRIGQAMQIAGMPRSIEQQENMYRLGELTRQQNERLMPIQVGQSVAGQRIGQTIPVVNPQSNPLAGLGGLLQGVGSIAGSPFGSMIGNAASSAFGGIGNILGGGMAGLNMFSPFASEGILGGLLGAGGSAGGGAAAGEGLASLGSLLAFA